MGVFTSAAKGMMTMCRTAFLLGMAMVLLGSIGTARAKSLPELMADVVARDPRIVQARMALEMEQYNVRSSYGEWLPAVDLSGYYGHEEIINEKTTNTYFDARKFQAKLTQTLFDLSKMVGVKSAKTTREVSGIALETVRQTLMLESITAYFNLARAKRQLYYARISENNLYKQAGSEKSRKQKGSGVATDVLQINQQLYGARATRVQAERTFQAASNNYKRVFKQDYNGTDALVLPMAPYAELSDNVETFVAEVAKDNLNLKQSRLAVKLAELADKNSRSEFLPNVDLVLQSQFKEDDGGTEHGKDEHIIKVDFTYNIFNGGKDYYATKNRIIAVQMAREALKDTARIVEESATNYWENFMTSKKRAEYLRNQAKTAEEFLEKAKTERKLGKRSLIDVLNGEINYINSISMAIAADTDMALAVYNMFFLMGQLNSDLITAYMPASAQGPEEMTDKPIQPQLSEMEMDQ